jgi:hypothetical protein
MIEVAGRPRLFWFSALGATYAECVSGCGTATPTWSTPISVGAGGDTVESRPLIRQSGGVLTTMWKASGALYHGECAGSCTSPISWGKVDIANGDNASHTIAYDISGTLRAAAWQDGNITDAGGLVYTECIGPCASAFGTWGRLELPHDPSGADLRLTALPDGGIRRSLAVYADETGGKIGLYGECESNCLQAASWAFASLANAKDPYIVFDAQGLPRVFATTTSDRLWVSRCSQRPCTSTANWTNQNLMTSDLVTGGNWADGGTFFLTSSLDGGALTLGVESGTTYTTRDLALCSGPATGVRPFAYSGPANRLRVVFGTPSNPSINFLYQAP